MVLKLSALRVAPELDASKYVPGATAIDAANENMADSAQRVALLMDGVRGSAARLGASYVEGYAQQVKFEKGINALDRALATGNVTIAQAEAIIEGLSRKTGLMVHADDLAAQGKHELAAAVGAVNARLALQEPIVEQAAQAQLRLANATRASSHQQANLVFQLNDVFVSLASGMNPMMVLIQQGSQIATIYGPNEGGIGRAFTETGKMAVGMVAKFWPIAAVLGAVAVGYAGLTTEINKTQKTQVSFGDVFQGTMELAWGAFQRFASPLLGWFGDLWGTISPYVSDTMIGLIQMFDLGYRDIGSIWNRLPAAMGEIIIDAANWMIVGMEGMINDAIGLLNDFIKKATDGLKAIGIDLGDISVGKVDFGELTNPLKGAGAGLAADLQANLDHVNSFDYGSMIGGAATNVHNRPSEEDAKKAADAAEKAAEAYDKLIGKTQQRIDQLGIEADALGLTAGQAMVLRHTQELLSEAEATGIAMTPERIAQITQLAETMTDAELRLKGLQTTMENRSPWQVMADEIANINELMGAGGLSADAFANEVAKSVGKMVSAYSDAIGGMVDIFSQFEDARSMQAQEELARQREYIDSLGLEGQAKEDAEKAYADAVEAEGRRAFEAEKQLSIARAVLSGGEAVMKAYTWGSALGGPIGGAIAAGFAGLAVAAQIAAISNTTYHSKSVATPAANSGGGSSSGADSGGTSRNFRFEISGAPNSSVGIDGVKELLTSMADIINDGHGNDFMEVVMRNVA